MLQLKNSPEVILIDNSRIQAAAQGTLPLHSSLSTQALVYPQLNNIDWEIV